MVQALLAGVSGIKNGQTAISATGADLSNIQTTGYKGIRVTFQEMLPQTLKNSSSPTASGLGGTNPVQYGLGSQIGSTQVLEDQGSLNATGRTLDVAIQGNGFLMTSDGTNMSYTRDGSLDLDATGTLIHAATGQKILGWQASSTGALDTTVPITSTSTIQLSGVSTLAAQVTSNVDLAGNLFSGQNPSLVTEVPIYVYDGLGNQIKLTVDFTNLQSPPLGSPPSGAITSWDWTVSDGSTTIGGYNTGSNERLYFDNSGNLLNAGVLGAITVPAPPNSAAFNINLNFSEMKQVASPSNVNMSQQDGLPPGSLQSYSIGNDGTITGRYSNGINKPIAQIAMASFVNSAGLNRAGNNLWQSTNNSGSPLVGTATSQGRGTITAGFLEQSNVDIGSKFSDMIMFQRGIQANTKLAGVVNTLLGDIIGMAG